MSTFRSRPKQKPLSHYQPGQSYAQAERKRLVRRTPNSAAVLIGSVAAVVALSYPAKAVIDHWSHEDTRTYPADPSATIGQPDHDVVMPKGSLTPLPPNAPTIGDIKVGERFAAPVCLDRTLKIGEDKNVFNPIMQQIPGDTSGELYPAQFSYIKDGIRVTMPSKKPAHATPDSPELVENDGKGNIETVAQAAGTCALTELEVVKAKDVNGNDAYAFHIVGADAPTQLDPHNSDPAIANYPYAPTGYDFFPAK